MICLLSLEFTKPAKQSFLWICACILIFQLPSKGGFWIQIPVSPKIPDTCSLISNTCCLAADRWESGVVKKNKKPPANLSVIRPYQVRVAGSWPASCCPLQLCCCCYCCCLLAALLPAPSYTRRRTDTGCTASWASWRSCWTYPHSGWWTARATSCSCSPEWWRSKVVGTARH